MAGGASEQTRSMRTPPYTSFRTFKTFIEDLRDQGVPSRIDRSVLTRFSGAVGTQLMHALRFLDLIDGSGQPTPRLRELVNAAGEEHWRRTFLEILRRQYAPMFAIDLEAATPSQFNETFRKAFPAADAVVQKCVTFFLYAASDAGVNISGRVLKGRKPRTFPPSGRHPVRRPPPKEAETAPSQPQSAAPQIESRKPSEMLLMYLDPSEMDDEQQAAVWTMLKYFKSRGL